jgi:hypothetical protein
MATDQKLAQVAQPSTTTLSNSPNVGRSNILCRGVSGVSSVRERREYMYRVLYYSVASSTTTF